MGVPVHFERRLFRSFALIMGLGSMMYPSAGATIPSADETQVRAAMVYNLTRFVDWPSWKFSDDSSPYVICFQTNDPVANDMDSLVREKNSRDVKSQDRPVVIHRVSSFSSIEGCHVLYVSKFDKSKLVDLLSRLNKSAVLTISDQPMNEGAIIALPLVENRVQIMVDLHAAQQSGLTLSSKLLHIATVTR